MSQVDTQKGGGVSVKDIPHTDSLHITYISDYRENRHGS